jgi:glutaredoxin 3
MNKVHWIQVKGVSKKDTNAILAWQQVHGGERKGSDVQAAPMHGGSTAAFPFMLQNFTRAADPQFPFVLPRALRVEKEASVVALPPPAAVAPAPAAIRAGATAAATLNKLRRLIASAPVVMFGKTTCPYCQRANAVLDAEAGAAGVRVVTVQLDTLPEMEEMQDGLEKLTGMRTVPNVFIHGVSVGGSDATLALHRSGKLARMLQRAEDGAAKDDQKPHKKLPRSSSPKSPRPTASRSAPSPRSRPRKSRSPRQRKSKSTSPPTPRRKSPATTKSPRRKGRGVRGGGDESGGTTVRHFYHTNQFGERVPHSARYTLDSGGAPIDVVKQIVQTELLPRARRVAGGASSAEERPLPSSVEKAVEQAVRQNFMCSCGRGASHCTDAAACKRRSQSQGAQYLKRYKLDAPRVFLDSITVYVREDGKKSVREYEGAYRLINNPSKLCIKNGVNKEVVAKYVATHKLREDE